MKFITLNYQIKNSFSKKNKTQGLNQKNRRKENKKIITKMINQMTNKFKLRMVKKTIRKQKVSFTDKYSILKKLGEGSNSVVYLCISKKTKQLLATKIISKRKMNSTKHLKNLKVQFFFK
jgi:hypothetical protein